MLLLFALLAASDKGALVIHGGGEISDEVKTCFASLAGGKDANVVVIPTAALGDPIDTEKVKREFAMIFGFGHVSVLHTRDRARADSPDFVEPLLHATAVWFSGGRQWRLADAYLGTATERAIKALLAAGGVVGGSSAGATILGSFLVRGQAGDARDPDGDNTIMMSPGHLLGFGLLPNSAIDQHVIARHRESDLAPVITAHPELLGIGIDQGAAILVRGGQLAAIGQGTILIHQSGRKYFALPPGARFDLGRRELIHDR